MEFTFKFTKVSVYFWLYYQEKMLLPKVTRKGVSSDFNGFEKICIMQSFSKSQKFD